MKAFLLFFTSFIINNSVTDSGFYGIKFNTINDVTINTSSFQGKTVVIALMSVSNSSLTMVNYLDSAQRSRKDLQVIAVPTGEFGGNITTADIVKLQKKLSIIISQPLKVKKNNGANQHPFFAWLTSVSQNKHFDQDADEEGKIFFINPKGTLYSILPKQTPLIVINTIINQSFNE